jgi:hypothetical protein
MNQEIDTGIPNLRYTKIDIMKKQTGAINFSGIEKAIVSGKVQDVIIDGDVARIYGVKTTEVNQAVRNQS